MYEMRITFPRRHEYLNGLTNELVARVASQDREALVRMTDYSVLVDEGNSVRQHLKKVVP
jgi:hypothetical protein